MPGEKNVASKALSPTFILGRAKKRRSKKNTWNNIQLNPGWLIGSLYGMGLWNGDYMGFIESI